MAEVLDFVDRIEAYIQGMPYQNFEKDSKTIDAVDVNEHSISEAVVCDGKTAWYQRIVLPIPHTLC